MRCFVGILLLSLLATSCVSKSSHERTIENCRLSSLALSKKLEIAQKRLQEQYTLGDLTVQYRLFVSEGLEGKLIVCSEKVPEEKILSYLYQLSKSTFKAADILKVDVRVLANIFMLDHKLDYCTIDTWFMNKTLTKENVNEK